MIREIQRNHIAECVTVIRESFLTVANEFGFTVTNAPRFTAFATTEERLVWQMEEQKRPMRAFFDGDKIVGYYSLALLPDGECELNNLCVLPAYRHKKIGAQLLEDAFALGRQLDCHKMQIGIVEENQVLRRWYESFGFVHTRVEKFDFFPFTCGYMEREL